jgi:DNA-directed RNA polymerase specialized sigma subunit
MGSQSKSTIFYKTVIELKNDINTLKIRLDSYINERAEWIKKSGPAALRTVTYDQPNVQTSGPKHSEEWVLDRIAELTGYIEAINLQLAGKQASLNRLRYQRVKSAEKMSTLQQKVFSLSVIDGKTNKEIAHELGYSKQRIKNIKVEVNAMIEGCN